MEVESANEFKTEAKPAHKILKRYQRAYTGLK